MKVLAKLPIRQQRAWTAVAAIIAGLLAEVCLFLAQVQILSLYPKTSHAPWMRFSVAISYFCILYVAYSVYSDLLRPALRRLIPGGSKTDN